MTGPPLWLLAELTYRCPLHCVFCYNPVDFAAQTEELGTDDWLRVLREGRELGAVQCGFSGGEPLLRDDLEVLVAEARRLGYYTNLLTSGVGLTPPRAAALKAAGLDHVQLSFQDSTREMNDFLTSTKTFDLKRKVARLVKSHDYPMVLNVVLHRMNLDHIEAILGLAEEMEADYVELANTQYYGWSFLNREHLLPTHAQLRKAETYVNEFRQRIGDRRSEFDRRAVMGDPAIAVGLRGAMLEPVERALAGERRASRPWRASSRPSTTPSTGSWRSRS